MQIPSFSRRSVYSPVSFTQFGSRRVHLDFLLSEVYHFFDEPNILSIIGLCRFSCILLKIFQFFSGSPYTLAGVSNLFGRNMYLKGCVADTFGDHSFTIDTMLQRSFEFFQVSFNRDHSYISRRLSAAYVAPSQKQSFL